MRGAYWHKLILVMVFFGSSLSANDECGRFYRNLSTAPLLSAVHDTVTQAVREGKDPRFVSIVIPVYRELANGNIIRLLENFTDQGASPKQFEIVLMVNNSPEVAANRHDTQPGKLELSTSTVFHMNSPASIWKENQDTIHLLQYVAGTLESPPKAYDSLPQWQKDIVEKARKRGLNLSIMDMSTRGIEKNMGLIRDTGLRATMERHKGKGEDNHILAMLDADTQVNPGYVENTIAFFSDPKVNSLFLSRDWRLEPGSDPILYKNSYQFRVRYQIPEMLGALNLEYSGGGGPQTISRARLFREIDGIPHFPAGEDGVTAHNLSQKGHIVTPHNVNIYIGDRFRPDGYDAIARKKMEFKDNTQRAIRKDLMVNAISSYFKNKSEISPSEAEAFFEYFGIPFSRSEWLKNFGPDGKKKGTGLKTHSSLGYRLGLLLEGRVKEGDPIQDTLGLLREKLSTEDMAEVNRRLRVVSESHNLGAKAIESALSDFISDPVSGSLSNSQHPHPLATEFLTGNPWIEFHIQSALKEGKSSAEILQGLRAEYPDWMESFENTPAKKRVDTANTLRFFFAEASAYHERHTSLQRLFPVLTGKALPE